MLYILNINILDYHEWAIAALRAHRTNPHKQGQKRVEEAIRVNKDSFRLTPIKNTHPHQQDSAVQAQIRLHRIHPTRQHKDRPLQLPHQKRNVDSFRYQTHFRIPQTPAKNNGEQGFNKLRTVRWQFHTTVQKHTLFVEEVCVWVNAEVYTLIGRINWRLYVSAVPVEKVPTELRTVPDGPRNRHHLPKPS